MNMTVVSSVLPLNTSESVSCQVESNHVSIAVLLCLVLFLGFFLNCFSLWIFCRRLSQWSSGTVLQFHLALSDAIATPSAPMMAVYFATGGRWPFGTFLCQLNIALLSSHFYGSTIFLTLISVHRYVAVVHFNRGSLMKRKGFVKKLCGGVWFLLLVKALVYVVILPLREEDHQCLSIHQNNLTDVYFVINFILFIFGFLMPFSVCALCYSRLASTVARLNINTAQGLAVKVKSQRMIGACLVIFGLCFLPLNVVRTVGVVLKKYYPKQCHVLQQFVTAYYVSWILAGVNCCLDPVLYCFGSQKFSKVFRSLKVVHRDVQSKSGSVTANS